MEVIDGPTAPAAPTTPNSGPQTVPPPNLVRAPAPAPPIDEPDPFGDENLNRLRTTVPEQKEKKADKPADKPVDKTDKNKPVEKAPESERPRDESGKFTKAEKDAKEAKAAEDAKALKDAEANKDKKEVKPGDKPPAKPEENKITGWQMARKHEATIKELNAKLTEYEGKLKATPPASAPPKLDDHPEWKAVNEKLTKAEQRRQQLEDEIRWYDYEKSTEYQEKFFKPYATEYQRALSEVQSFKVNLPDGQTRPASKEDFQSILSSATPAEALEKAEKLFGSNASTYIVGLRNSVLRKAQEAQDARSEFATKGAAELKNRAAREEQEANERAATFDRLNKEAAEQHPQWFKEADGDDEGNTLLKMGNMLVDAAFGGQIEDPETKQMRDPTPEELVRINSMIRTKAGAFDRVIHRHKVAMKEKEQRIAELEAELKDYRDSTPGAGNEGSASAKSTVDNDDDLPEALRG